LRKSSRKHGMRTMAEPTRCAFCGSKWDPGVKMVKSQDESKLICTECIEKAKSTLRYHETIGTSAKIIRPRWLSGTT
jgi:predicted transcriptional regulator